MDHVLNDAGDYLDAFLLWLRVTPTVGFPTVSHGEVVYSPLIVSAFLFRLGAVLDMLRLLRRLRREGKDEELGASVRERLQRSQRGMLRLGIWGVICWALLVNYEYSTIVFTMGLLGYAVIENIDGLLGWKYQLDRKRYWRERDEREDFAEQVARRAEVAAERAELAAAANIQQGQRIEAALEANTATTEEIKVVTAETHKLVKNGHKDEPHG